jgi:DNA recombination protein RmuC
LHRRLAAVGEHVSSLGRHLAATVGAYNRAVGSIETRLLVTSRKLADLGLVDAPVGPSRTLDELPRPVTAPERGGDPVGSAGEDTAPSAPPAPVVSLRGAS